MSHSSGITISQSLHEEWKKSSNQLLQIIISNEELVLQTKVNNDLQTEEWNFNQMKLIANPKEACFFLFKLKDSFILYSFVPDGCPTRDKMIYASTKSTLLKELGDSVNSSFYASNINDLSWDNFKLLTNDNVPLTKREEEMKQIKKEELNAEISISSRKSNMSSSLDFPLTVSARNDLSNFKTGMIAFSIVNEEIQSDGTFNSDNLDEIIIQLKNCIDQVTPHYFFMKFNHNQDNLNLFGYICPPESPVRQRMLYSSCRATLISHIENILNFKIDRKWELSSILEVTSANVLEELKQNNSASSSPALSHGFVKKKIAGPGKGPRQLNKKNEQ